MKEYGIYDNEEKHFLEEKFQDRKLAKEFKCKLLDLGLLYLGKNRYEVRIIK